MKLQGIRLLVEDFDGQYEFYKNKIGLEVVWGEIGGSYASFKIGDIIGLSIFTASYMDEALGIKGSGPRRYMDTAVLVIDTDDLEEVYERLLSKGVEFVTKPHDMPGWGNRCAHFRDPEGNLIELSTALDEEKWNDALVTESKKYQKNHTSSEETTAYKHDSALEDWEEDYDYLDGTYFPRWG